MDFKKKEVLFRKLSQKMITNRKRIVIFKKGASILMVVFIITAFFSLYTNKMLQDSHNFKALFYVVLFVSFAIMLGAHFFIVSKIKENRYLDTKIYHLMKLKI